MPARQNLGPRPTRPNDAVDIEWVMSTFPSYSITVTRSADYVIDLPADPIDHTMVLVEVIATAPIVVTYPVGVLLTTAITSGMPLHTGKVGFFGFRYSATADAWFLMSTTQQV